MVVIVFAVLMMSLKYDKQKDKTADTGLKPANTDVKSDENKKPENDLLGTWISSESGKGMRGEGELVSARATTSIVLNGDPRLVVASVAGNMASGTIAYENLCYTVTIAMPGKDPIVQAPRCVDNGIKPVQLQIDGNKLIFEGKSEIGIDLSFSGEYTKDTLKGTFVWSSPIGKVDGGFDLQKGK